MEGEGKKKDDLEDHFDGVLRKESIQRGGVDYRLPSFQPPSQWIYNFLIKKKSLII